MKNPLKIAVALSKIAQLQKSNNSSTDKVKREVLVGSYASQIVAYDLILPSSPVDNLRQWYFDNCSQVATESLVTINEKIIIDLTAAIRRTQAIWELRYNMLHKAGHPSTLAATLAGLTTVGVNDYLSPEFTNIIENMNTIPEIRELVYFMNTTEE